MNFIQNAKSIVVGVITLTIAVAVIRPSRALAQADSVKIGPDQSKASKSETFAWLRQRVPELGTFTYYNYDSVTTYAPGTNWPPLSTTFLTTLSPIKDEFRWIAIDGCEVQFERITGFKSGRSIRDYAKVPLQTLDPLSFEVSASRDGGDFGRPLRTLYWKLRMGSKGNSKPIYNTETTPIAHAETWSPFTYIELPDQESAERVGRALKHAAILCGARADPF
jgi:hypothetical protein